MRYHHAMSNAKSRTDEHRDAHYRSLSFWHDTLPASLQPRPPLESDVEADVAIVGTGYTGLWTAYYLHRHAPSLNIVMVEADIAGFGASGRNGGWCSCFLVGIEHWASDPQTREHAIVLQRLMFDTVDEVGRVAARKSIDCHFDKSGGFAIARGGAQLKRLESQFEFYRQAGLTPGGFRWLDAAEAVQSLPMDKARAGLRMNHVATIHPARLVRGLADCLAAGGVRIFEDSAATDIESGIVSTRRGSVRAPTIVRATEAYTRTISGHERALAPVHSMMVATEPLNDEQLAATGLQRRYAFGDLSPVVTYGQLTADRRIAFGCRGRYYFGSGIHSTFAGSEPEFEVVRRTLIQLFPALWGIRFSHAWDGALGLSRNLLPVVSFDRSSGYGWAGGYAGNGVAAANLAGRTLADLILERATDRCHTPWVNPATAPQWEPEPIRWLGIAGYRRWLGVRNAVEGIVNRLTA